MNQVIRTWVALVAVLALGVGCTENGGVGTLSAAHTAVDAGVKEVDAHVPPPPRCTLTQGFWKNHPDAWPSGFRLTIGGVDYSALELLIILRTPPRGGDASMILAHQLIAAILNGGLYDPNIDDVVVDALAWMDDHTDGRLPYGVRGGDSGHSSGTALADALAYYNEGNAGTPHCDSRPPYTPPAPYGASDMY